MSYATIAAITQSSSLYQRLTACVAKEKGILQPGTWVSEHIWKLAATDGWAEKWIEAPEGDDPGADESIISDADILEAVNAIS